MYKYFIGELMFTKIKEFFLGKPVAETQAPYKVEAPQVPQETHVEVAPITAPIVAEPVAAKPAAKKAAPAAKKQQFDKKPPAVKKPVAKKPV
jgi:hypothetical protein